jgi:hypothetical protein
MEVAGLEAREEARSRAIDRVASMEVLEGAS